MSKPEIDQCRKSGSALSLMEQGGEGGGGEGGDVEGEIKVDEEEEEEESG